MAHDRRKQAALSMALELALTAKLGEQDAAMLGRVVIAAGEAFDLGHPFQSAIKSFSSQYPDVRRDPAMLRVAGEDLLQEIKRASWPDLAARLDIEG